LKNAPYQLKCIFTRLSHPSARRNFTKTACADTFPTTGFAITFGVYTGIAFA
jgi:hypothetical protein